MESRDIQFSRESLKHVIAEIKELAPDFKNAWVIKTSFRDMWEFHYGAFYWAGDADNAYDARERGWSAWLYSTRGVYERKLA